MKVTSFKSLFQSPTLQGVLHGAELALLVLAAVVAIATFLPGKSFTGSYRLFTVMSGSMEPAIGTGALVISQPVSDPQPNEVIIYEDPRSNLPNSFVIHRVSDRTESEGKVLYQTKGDANNVKDSYQLESSQIIGKHWITIPYLGYVSGYAKTPAGLVLLAILPAAIVIVLELHAMKRAIERQYQTKLEAALRKQSEESSPQEKQHHLKSLLLLGLVSVSLISNTSQLSAAFYSRAGLGNQTFATGSWLAPVAPLFWLEENDTTVLLEWQTVPEAAEYLIYRAEITNPGTFTLVTTITDNSTSYLDTGLSPNTTYLYKISSMNTFGFETALNDISPASATTYHIVVDSDGYQSDYAATGTSTTNDDPERITTEDVDSARAQSASRAVGGDFIRLATPPQNVHLKSSMSLEGTYDIYVTYVCDASYGTANYRVLSGGTLLTPTPLELDQSLRSSDGTSCGAAADPESETYWSYLGTFEFDGQAQVRISQASSEVVTADAVSFVRSRTITEPIAADIQNQTSEKTTAEPSPSSTPVPSPSETESDDQITEQAPSVALRVTDPTRLLANVATSSATVQPVAELSDQQPTHRVQPLADAAYQLLQVRYRWQRSESATPGAATSTTLPSFSVSVADEVKYQVTPYVTDTTIVDTAWQTALIPLSLAEARDVVELEYTPGNEGVRIEVANVSVGTFSVPQDSTTTLFAYPSTATIHLRTAGTTSEQVAVGTLEVSPELIAAPDTEVWAASATHQTVVQRFTVTFEAIAAQPTETASILAEVTTQGMLHLAVLQAEEYQTAEVVVEYEHTVEGSTVLEALQTTLELGGAVTEKELYLGTCSGIPGESACVSHLPVSNVKVNVSLHSATQPTKVLQLTLNSQEGE